MTNSGTLERVRRSEVLGFITDLPKKGDAERVLSDRLRAINSGQYRPQSNCTFKQFVEETWLPEVLPSFKYSTQLHYQYVCKGHLLPAFGDLQLRAVTRDLVQKFLAAKFQKGLSAKTVKHLRTCFGTVLTGAEERGLIPENPVRKTRLPLATSESVRPDISTERVLEILNALPQPSRSIASLLCCTALRIGELLALRWRDIDFERGILQVRQTVYEGHFGTPKTKRSRRPIPLVGSAKTALLEMRPAVPNPDALVFSTHGGSPLSRRNLLNRQLTPTCQTLKIAGVNWHWFRHATATFLDYVGVPLATIQEILGHSSSEITREIYLHSVTDESRRALEKVDDLLFGPKFRLCWKMEVR